MYNFTYRIKFLLFQKKKLSNEKLKLLGCINNIMNRLYDSFQKHIISQYYYNKYMKELDLIHDDYKNLNELYLTDLNKSRLKYNNIKQKLIVLSPMGMMNISSQSSELFKRYK